MAKKEKEPESREEAVTGKPAADETVKGLDKDSREYHVTHRK